MPNVVGIWSPGTAEESIRRTVERQLARVRTGATRYLDRQGIFAGFGMALQDHGLLENGEQPVTSRDGRHALLLDGEIYNRDDLVARYRADLADTDTAPTVCLKLILRHGTEVLRELNGLFCIVLYDSRDRRLTLISDRYGFRPLFYARHSDTVLFATEIKGIHVADPEPPRTDALGLLELFCYGSQVCGRTWLRGYRRLAPATVLTFDERGADSRPYWTYRYDEGAPTLDQASYFTGFAKRLDRAVERCMRGSHRIGAFLSGGYDSRAVVAAIREERRPIPAVTFGDPRSRDVRFARLLADRLGLEHHTLSGGEAYLHPHCHAIVWRTEGMLPFSSLTSIRHHARLKQELDIVLTGFLGEFSGSHTWLELLLARSREAAIRAIFERMVGGRVAAARRVFNRSFFTERYEELQDAFRKSFDPVQDAHPLNVADSWNVMHLQPHGTYQSPAVDRHLFEVRAPHMDTELVSFLLTIPPRQRLEQRVYKKVIAYSYPEIRDVPCTNSERPIEPRFALEYAKMVSRLAGRKLASAWRRVSARPEPLGREIGDLAEDFRSEPRLVSDVLRPLLQAGAFDPAIFDPSGIEALIDEHYERGARHEAILSLLISWGIAAKYFLMEDLSDVPPEMLPEP